MQNSTSPVITSLLDTDLYKFTMLQSMVHSMPGNTAVYRFVCRGATAIPLGDLADEVNAQLDALCQLRFTAAELDYLGGLRFIKPDFVHFLRMFQLHRDFIRCWSASNGQLCIEASGPQLHVTLYEIYVMAIVSELYFRKAYADHDKLLNEGRNRLAQNIERVRDYEQNVPGSFQLSDFGVRRRFSKAWQSEVVNTLSRELPKSFVATSNVKLAMDYGLIPVGTMAHEYLQTFQAMPSVQLRNSQRAALEAWVQEYRGDLGIALTDVIGMDAFLEDFDLYFSKLFDGVRHDSGCPFEWGEKAIAHYQKHRIDPRTKRLVFSDGLDFKKAFELHKVFKDRIQVAFGIGTKLTCDMGVPALNIVMKAISINGRPVAKLSDSPGKTLCEDQVFLAYLRQVFNKPELVA